MYRPMKKLAGLAVLGFALAAAPLSAATVDEALGMLKAHKFPQAEAAFAGLAGAEPDNAAVRSYWALTLAELARPDDARAQLTKARESSAPVDLTKTVEARLKLGDQQADAALALLNEGLAANPDSGMALHYRGLAFANKRDFAKSIESLERSLELDPGFAYTHYYLGMAYNGMRRPDKAVAHLQQFVQQAPDAPDADKVRSLLKAFR